MSQEQLPKTSSSYFLPANNDEAERLMSQHLVLIDAVSERIVLSPINLTRPGLKSLDSGTADGHWIRELRNSLPDPAVHSYLGTDINASQFPTRLPPDSSFQVQNIADEWPAHLQSSFDLLVEAEQEGPDSGLVFHEFFGLFRGLFEATGAGWHYAHDMRDWLEACGAVDVDECVVDLRFGAKNPDSRLADLSATSMAKTMDGLVKHVKMAPGLRTDLSVERMDTLGKRLLDELVTRGACYRIRCVWCRKKRVGEA